MSVFRFIYTILKGEPITLYGDETQKGISRMLMILPWGRFFVLRFSGYEIINLGSGSPHSLRDLVSLIEELSGRRANFVYLPSDKGDLPFTWADIGKARKVLEWEPRVPLLKGLENTLRWTEENWGCLSPLATLWKSLPGIRDSGKRWSQGDIGIPADFDGVLTQVFARKSSLQKRCTGSGAFLKNLKTLSGKR